MSVNIFFTKICAQGNLVLLCLQELFSQAYQRVGVIFVSMPNFVPFYIEMSNERRATEALQVLQNVVADFDEVSYVENKNNISMVLGLIELTKFDNKSGL